MTTPTRPPFDEVDPDAPASDEERREADSLRAALDDPRSLHEGAELARALVAAHVAPPLDVAANRALVARAVGPTGVVVVRTRVRRRAGVWVGSAAGALALAAAVLVAIMPRRDVEAPRADLQPLLNARSTQPLFRHPFETRARASDRIDRIAMARGSDLRDNLYTRWDVR